MEADKASDLHTESSVEQNSQPTVEQDDPKWLQRDGIVPYTCYYTTTVFVHTVHLDISCAVKNMATEVAIQVHVYSAGIYANRTGREN